MYLVLMSICRHLTEHGFGKAIPRHLASPWECWFARLYRMPFLHSSAVWCWMVATVIGISQLRSSIFLRSVSLFSLGLSQDLFRSSPEYRTHQFCVTCVTRLAPSHKLFVTTIQMSSIHWSWQVKNIPSKLINSSWLNNATTLPFEFRRGQVIVELVQFIPSMGSIMKWSFQRAIPYVIHAKWLPLTLVIIFKSLQKSITTVFPSTPQFRILIHATLSASDVFPWKEV